MSGTLLEPPYVFAQSGTFSAPFTFTVPASLAVRPDTAHVTFDGSGAAGDFLACMSFYDSNGNLVARVFNPNSVVAGDVVEVTYVPPFGSASSSAIEPVQTLVGARIQATSTQSVSASTNTDLVYQQVYFDTDNMANLGTDARILTVNTPGIYLVIVETVWAANTAGRRINIAIQNGFYSAGPIPAQFSSSDERNAVWTGGGRSANVSVGIFNAAVGDFFSSGGFQGSGSTLSANGFSNCFLSALLIGST